MLYTQYTQEKGETKKALPMICAEMRPSHLPNDAVFK